jgi:ribosome biogenesis protein Tsr3
MYIYDECTLASKIMEVFSWVVNFSTKNGGPLEVGEGGKGKSGKRAILSERSAAERV